MNEDAIFSDKVAVRIWDQYFRRLGGLVRALDKTQRDELVVEIKGHLLESCRSDASGSEAERLLNAIERLGEPESYIKPMLAERLLSSASKSLRPKYVLKGLYYHLVGGVRRAFAGVLFGIGYLTVFVLSLLGVLKVFFPNNVGMFSYEDGGFVLGMEINPEGARTDLLGYWVIPVYLGLAVLLYIGLTKWLKVLRGK